MTKQPVQCTFLILLIMATCVNTVSYTSDLLNVLASQYIVSIFLNFQANKLCFSYSDSQLHCNSLVAHFWSATYEVINLFIFTLFSYFSYDSTGCYTSLFSEVCQSMKRKCLNWCSVNKTYSILSWTVYILIALLKIMCSKR